MVRKIGFVILTLTVSIYLFGCGKKQQTLESMQEPMSIEALSTVGTQTQAAPQAQLQEVRPQGTAAVVNEPKTEAVLPQGPVKPTTEEIQKALKNAGYYTGNVDGKKGPMTKKAIEDFQKANGLQVDGKVGPQTWVILSKHLETVTITPVTRKKR